MTWKTCRICGKKVNRVNFYNGLCRKCHHIIGNFIKSEHKVYDLQKELGIYEE